MQFSFKRRISLNINFSPPEMLIDGLRWACVVFHLYQPSTHTFHSCWSIYLHIGSKLGVANKEDKKIRTSVMKEIIQTAAELLWWIFISTLLEKLQFLREGKQVQAPRPLYLDQRDRLFTL